MLIKSKVKYIQSLSHKKFRDEEGVFVAEGPKIINELLASDVVSPVEIYAIQEWHDKNADLISKNSEVLMPPISLPELERISFLSAPNEVLAIFKKPVFQTNDNPGLILMLDNLQDPGNLGTIIRCADWFGVTRIICNPGSADQFNPKVVQSTMASIARVEVIYTDLAGFIQSHPGKKIYAAALNGKNLQEFGRVDDGILVIGNESKGISEAIMNLATEKITIPKTGMAESLNAAVATGIILSHIVAP